MKKISPKKAPTESNEAFWTFLTNHSHVLLCLARDPGVRMRDVAQIIGITERAVQRIVADLEKTGYISRIRCGRRNYYEIREDMHLRHPIEMHEKVRSLIAFVCGPNKRLPDSESTPKKKSPSKK